MMEKKEARKGGRASSHCTRRGRRPGEGALLLAVVMLAFPGPVQARMSHMTTNIGFSFVNGRPKGTEYPNQYFVADIDGDGMADIARINCQDTSDPLYGTLLVGYGMGAGSYPGGHDPGYSETQGFRYANPTRAPYYYQYPNICQVNQRIDLVNLTSSYQVDIIIYDWREEEMPLSVRFNLGNRLGFSAEQIIFYKLRAGPPPLSRKNVVRFGDVDGDHVRELVRFQLDYGLVYVHRLQDGCAPSVGCVFEPYGTLWASNFAFEGDEPFLGRFTLSPAGAVKYERDILKFDRQKNRNSPHYFGVKVADNLGTSFGAAYWAFPAEMGDAWQDPTGTMTSYRQQAFVADMNDDKLDDIIVFERTPLYLNPSNNLSPHDRMYVALNNDWIRGISPHRFGTYQCPECAKIDYATNIPGDNDVLWYVQDTPTYWSPSGGTFDQRPRVFGLGDVDGDGYVDYVSFPGPYRDLDAWVRFQMVVYMHWGISDTLIKKYGWKGPYIGHPYKSSRWSGIGIKEALDPFISYDSAMLGDAWTPPCSHGFKNVCGNTYHYRMIIPGSGTHNGQAWDDRDQVSELELETMYEGAKDVRGYTMKTILENPSKGEYSIGIYHHLRFGILMTTGLEGDECNDITDSWHMGLLWWKRCGERDVSAVFVDSIRNCEETYETKTAVHELGHTMNLCHIYCHDCYYRWYDDVDGVYRQIECCEKGDWCTCGVYRSIIGYEHIESEYDYWFSFTSRLHLQGQEVVLCNNPPCMTLKYPDEEIMPYTGVGFQCDR